MNVSQLIRNLEKVKEWVGPDAIIEIAIKTSDDSGYIRSIGDEEVGVVKARHVSTDGEGVTISN